MKRQILFERTLALFFILSCTICRAAELRLASGGQTSYQIVLPTDAIPAERTAARELQNHLKQITGAEFPVVGPAATGDAPYIAVGFPRGLPASLSKEAFPDLGPEEFVIESEGETLLLAGGRPRGALYAVYEFLERLGVRWHTPTETKIPHSEELTIEVTSERYTSPFRSRTNVLGTAVTPEWSARNRMNSFLEWGNPGEEYGGGVLQGPDMHTMWRLMHSSVFEVHPDWAAMVNGERQIKHANTAWGACFSNPELRKYIVDQTLDWLRKHPGTSDVWWGQNDGSPICNCPQCLKLYHAHGDAPSAANVLVVNELATAVAKEFPGVHVKTLAYDWSLKAPVGMKLADNVTVMLCATFGYFSELGQDEDTHAFLQNVEKWKQVASDFEVYLYSHPINNYWFPAACLYSQARNIQRIKDLGFRSIHQEIFGCNSGVGGELIDLRAWLYTRLAWRPDADVEELIQDFCRGYYGDAAEDVLFAIHKTEEAHANGWRPATAMTSFVVPGYVNPEAIAAVLPRLQAAYERQTDPIMKRRVGYALLPYLWADYWLGFNGFGKISPVKGIWGCDIADRERREPEGTLIKHLMLENQVTAYRNDGKFNPQKLRLAEMAHPYKYIQIVDNKSVITIVPELMGKMTEFSRQGHNVIKPLWGYLLTEYPSYGYGRDFFNGTMPDAFRVTSQTADAVELEAALPNGVARKSFSLSDGRLSYTIAVTASQPSTFKLEHQPLLDLNQDAFGFFPDLMVRTDNGWRLVPVGRFGDFWYQDGVLDISGNNGQVILVAESRHFALEINFDATNTCLGHMYDRAEFQPEGTGHILELMFSVPDAPLNVGQTLSASWTYRILLPDEFPDFN